MRQLFAIALAGCGLGLHRGPVGVAAVPGDESLDRGRVVADGHAVPAGDRLRSCEPLPKSADR